MMGHFRRTRRVAWAGLAVLAVNLAFQGCESPSTPSPVCQYMVSPATVASCMSGGTDLTLQVSTPAGCAWTASTSVPWIALTSAAFGSGASVLRVRLSDNWDAPREGVVRVQGTQPSGAAEARIEQAGCRYWVSQEVFTFGSSGGQGVFEVLQQSDPVTCGGPLQNACWWSAVADAPWITVTTVMPRVGDDRVTFEVAPSGGSAARTAAITVRDKVIRVTQW